MPDPLDNVTLITGDCREVLAGMEPGSVQCVVTSPPYFPLRDYNLEPSVWGDGWRGCLGLEPTPDLYVAHIVEVFRGVKRVLREDSACWLNLGDSYTSGGRGANRHHREKMGVGTAGAQTLGRKTPPPGLKYKDLCCIPWRVAMALQADGWYLRAALPWVKRSAMPESAADRPNSAVEYVFQLTKSARYFFDMEAVRVKVADVSLKRAEYGWDCDRPSTKNASMGGEGIHVDKMGARFVNPAGRHFRNGDLWFQSIGEPHGMVFLDDEPVGLDVNPAGFGEAHFATFPPKLIEPLIKAGTSERGCCPKCQKPWERVIDRSEKAEIPHWSERAGAHRADAPGAVVSETSCFRTHQVAVPRTLGWRPTCSCALDPGPFSIARVGFDPVPCTVLDPFSGAGTVALAAARLGRRAIGIEAKAEYNAMAEKRIGQALRPATYQDQSEPGPGEAPLFAETNP